MSNAPITADEFELPASDSDLSSIRELARQQLELEKAIADKEAEVAELKKQLTQIEQRLLPDAMFKAGLPSFKTTSGHEVTVKEDIAISIPKDKMDSVATWLEDNGHADVVVGQVIVDLARNSHNERKAAIEALVNIGLEPRETNSVNTATLKKILKEHLAKGATIDLAEFGGFAWKKAVIKELPKNKA